MLGMLPWVLGPVIEDHTHTTVPSSFYLAGRDFWGGNKFKRKQQQMLNAFFSAFETQVHVLELCLLPKGNSLAKERLSDASSRTSSCATNLR